MTNPIIFFDFELNSLPLGRILIELFSDSCPKAAENFRQFCTGEFRISGISIGYKNSKIFKIKKNLFIQGGDFLHNSGKGLMSIYGGTTFDDENLSLVPDAAGFLCLVNNGPNSNSCQFVITCDTCTFMFNKFQVIGRVIDDKSLLTLMKINNLETDPKTLMPCQDIVISECGEM